MARRRTARKKKAQSIDDCQRTLEVRSGSSSMSSLTIHVPDMLMRANRRQYTQCRAYDLRLKTALVDETNEHFYEIYTLSNAWWVKRAIEMAKGVWLESTKEERALLGDKKATYHDFIISSAVGASGNFSNLYSYAPASSGSDLTASEVASDESLYESSTVSEVKDDDGDAMGFTVLGEDKTGPGVFNIFNEYLLATNVTPQVDSRAGPYADLMEIDEDAMLALQSDGDYTPWDADAFPSPFVLVDVIGQDQGSGGMPHAQWSKTFTAPLGIVILRKRTNGGSADNYDGNEKILIEAKKGTYRGVHAPAYRAMNGVLNG